MRRLLSILLLIAARVSAADIPSAPDAKLRAEKQERRAAKAIAIGMVVPFWAHKWALDNLEGPQTFSRWPYKKEGPGGYVGAGARTMTFELEGGIQSVYRGGPAKHARGRLRTESRIGGDFSWSAYEARGLQTLRAADYITAHVTASLLEREDSLLEFGWGLASMQRDKSSTGASVVLNYQCFRKGPWIAGARYEPAILLDGRFYHELKGEAGAVYGPFGLTGGVRAFLTPLRNAWGPEATLKIFL